MTDKTTQSTPSLTLQDLDSIVKVIDVVVQRGAIKGDEMLTVGTLREKVASVVKAAVEAQDKPETVTQNVNTPKTAAKPKAGVTTNITE